MDDEDLTEQAEAQTLQTNQDFAGFGATEQDRMRKGKVMDLFRTEGETMGVKLLRRMGWRDGQGIGPRVRRKARFDPDEAGDQEEHLFAPDDTRIASFARKDDRKGLGFGGIERLAEDSRIKENEHEPEENDDEPYGTKTSMPKSKAKPRTGAFGMGVLNDTGSDDEDPYAMGPSISYNRVIGGNKKKQKPKAPKPTSTANPLLSSKPIFKSTKLSTPSGFRKCHDGRLPLDGFLLSTPLDALSISEDAERYPIPVVPEGWQSSKNPSPDARSTPYQSTADVAKASHLDPKSRAALLGETPLTGKSIFDFLSPAQRERIASASGRKDLPTARGEAIPGSAPEEESVDDLPQIDKDTAAAALGRGVGGWMPYTDDPAKRERYRGFLELNAGLRDALPSRPPDLKKTAWIAELREFAHAARVFRPVSGAMASRFQSSSAAPLSSAKEEVLTVPVAKKEDPAEEAARLGMFGPLTRSVLTFYPTRLLCKRFNVKVPAHVNSQTEGTAPHAEGEMGGRKQDDSLSDATAASSTGATGAPAGQLLLGLRSFASGGVEHAHDAQVKLEEMGGLRQAVAGKQSTEDESLDAGKNDALEAQRAGEELFKAVFGDDSD